MKTAALVVVLFSAVSSATEIATTLTPEPQRLGVYAGLGYLASPGTNGTAFSTGARLAIGRHFALNLDLGYGVLTAASNTQDRWWIIPTAAFVLPAGRVRFDLGAGLGLGTSSGYPTMSSFLSAPFMPAWAFQLVPIAKVHLMASTPLTPNVEVFARAELLSLLLDGNQIGLLDGGHQAGIGDTLTLNLWVGFQFGLL